MAAAPVPPSAGDAPVIRFRFGFEPLFLVAGLPFGVTPATTWVELAGDRLHVRFGPWSVDTAVSNVTDVEVTGPYSVPRVLGPPHLSFADRGLTFATNATEGACLRLAVPVPGLAPGEWIRHPAITVTVEDVDRFVTAVDRLRRSTARAGALEELTVAELRDRARDAGVERYSRLKKPELVSALRDRAATGEAPAGS